jgi:hypothetical protein
LETTRQRLDNGQVTAGIVRGAVTASLFVCYLRGEKAASEV